MQLLENGKPLCPILSIQDTNRTDFVVQFGSLIPLSANSLFYITTPEEPNVALGVQHLIVFPAAKRRWNVHVRESFKVGEHFASEVVFLGQTDL